MAKRPGFGLAAACCHRPVHGLDDVAAQTEFAQRRLEARRELPASRRDPFGQPEAFKLDRAGHKVLVEAGAAVIWLRAQINKPGIVVGDGLQPMIETRPAFGFDLAFEAKGRYRVRLRWPSSAVTSSAARARIPVRI